MTPRGLGLGMDLPWRGPYGIVGEAIAPRTLAFLERHGYRFASAFVSWQPRDRGVPRPEHVFGPWDAFFAQVPHAARCLHQTALNLAAERYDRAPVIALTNALIARYGFAWVNEDLGYWSADGWPLPYPQAPPLTDAAVAHCAAVCAEVDAALDAPLVVEFPGYEAVPEGPLDAYDAFRRIVEASGCACNLDTGHLLTWRWLNGHRGDALLGDLDRLPLDRTVEIHCAGVAIHGDQLIDAHHGVLADIQLRLVEALMERCPALRLVTYEDPRFDEDGGLPPRGEASLEALEALVSRWTPADGPWVRHPSALEEAAAPEGAEAALKRAFFEATPYGRRCRDQVLDRRTRGLPAPRELYAGHLGDDADATVAGFLASAEGEAWSDFAWARPGRALEDALGRYLDAGDAHLLACARLLVLHADPPFAVPEGFRRVPAGWLAVGGTAEAPVLYAALGGRLVTGPLTPLLVDLLDGARPPGSEPAVARLEAMGCL